MGKEELKNSFCPEGKSQHRALLAKMAKSPKFKEFKDVLNALVEKL